MFRSHHGTCRKLSHSLLVAAALLATALCDLPSAQAAKIDAREAAILTDKSAAATIDETTWATPKPIVSANALDTTVARNVRMATDYNQHWVAAYHTSNPKSDGTLPAGPSRLIVSSSNNDAGSWSDPATLPKAPESETDYSFRPDIEFGNSGSQEYTMVYEAFTSPTGTLLYQTHSTDAGLSWDVASPLGSFPNNNGNPRKVSIASDHMGDYMAAWIADADSAGPPGLNIAFSSDGANWSLVKNVPNVGDDRPQVRCHRISAADPSRWVVVFDQQTPSVDYNVMYAVSADDGANWVMQPINTDAADDGLDDLVPRIQFSPTQNSWVAVWAREGSSAGLYDIMFSRADEADFNNTDGGLTWSDPDFIEFDVEFKSRPQIDAWLSTDDSSHWMTLWSEVTQESAPPLRDLVAAVSDDDGFTWGATSFIDDMATSRPQWNNPVLDSSRNGRWLGMWQNQPQAGRTAADAETAVPWYSTTFIPLNDQQQFTDVSIQPSDINQGAPIYATVDFTVTYAITNLSQTPAFNVDVSITAQAPMQATGYTDLGGTLTPFLLSPTQLFPAQTVAGSYQEIDPGETALLQINYQCPVAGAFTLRADATPHDSIGNVLLDSDQSNNVDVETVIQVGQPSVLADLRITKTSYPVDTAIIGDYLGYTITVWNDSANDAPGVVVLDPIPAGLQFVYANASQGTWDEVTTGGVQIVTAHLGTIGGGKRATFTLATIPLAGGPTSATNTATASFDGVEIDPSNNSASVTVAFANGGGTGADLTLTKTANVNPTTQGTSMTYTLLVHNVGPSVASGVVITDVLPTGITFNGEFHTRGTVSRSGSTITANIGTLQAGSSGKVNISVVPTLAGNIANTATVTAATSDPDTSNNSSTAQVVVNEVDSSTVADLSVTKTASPSPATVGSPLTYTIQVSNAGPATASNVHVQDVLPPEVAFTSSSPTESSYSGGIVSYLVPSLNSGATSTFQILTMPIAAGTAVNTVSVSSDNPDLTPLNNTASVSVVINPGNGQPTNADLALSSSVQPTSTSVGNAITWTLTAHNNGPQSAANIHVTTTLPNTVTFVSASGPNGTATPIANQLDVPITTLGVGADATVTIVLVPQSGGNLTLTGNITGNVTDSVSANNTATSIVPVSGNSTFDLLGTWLKLKKKAKAGLVPSWSIKASLSVKNLRTTLVVAAPVQFYLSNDSTYSPGTDTLIGARAVKKIKPGKFKKASLSAKFTSDPSGKYLLAVINPTGSSPENVVPILIP